MTVNEINEQYRLIAHMLDKGRMKEAMTQLSAYLENCNAYKLRTKLEEVQTSYQYMLQYMKQGVEDAGRTNLYRHLQAVVWMLADQVHLHLLDQVSPSYYHTLRKSLSGVTAPPLDEWLNVMETFTDDLSVCSLMPDNKEALKEALERHEQAQKRMFMAVWVNSAWGVEDAASFRRALDSVLMPSTDLSLLVSAVTLSLLQCFDPLKLKALIEAYTHTDAQVSCRALVGIVLVLLVYPQRINLYPDLCHAIELQQDNPAFTSRLTTLYLQLLRAQDTEQVDKKMRNEIIPEMIKNVNLMRGMKLGIDESDDNDINPDWEETLNQSKLGDHIREISELQMEGSDVYMSTFSQLKNFPFFRDLHHWFYPFDRYHSSIIHLFGLKQDGENNLLNLVLLSGFFCNSDKYSLCFTMEQVPPSQRNMMYNQIAPDELGDLDNEEHMNRYRQHAERPEVLITQYIHDLYRFFKLYPRRLEFQDPFKSEMNLHELPLLSRFLSAPEQLRQVADFHFRKEHYERAILLYSRLADTSIADADLFQKWGYSLQKEKRYKEAVRAYRNADICKPDHLWTIRHLATCYRLMHDFEFALEYYKKAASIQPDNYNILFYSATCLVELGQYDEALRLLFKLDYMAEGNEKTWRAIAWCSFLQKNYAQALRYYNKLLAASPVATDYMNAAHVAWVMADVPGAATLYTQAAEAFKSRDAFLDAFDKDVDTLIAHGIDSQEIPLMKDLTL